MLNKIKILLGITDKEKDDLINVLIELTEEEVRDYCGIEALDGMKNTIIQMVIFKYNRIGTEGLTSENYNGASYNYMSEYPDNIKKILNKHRRIKVM